MGRFHSSQLFNLTLRLCLSKNLWEIYPWNNIKLKKRNLSKVKNEQKKFTKSKNGIKENLKRKFCSPAFCTNSDINCVGSPDGLLHCDIVVSEFELQSLYYIHFQTNTFGKVWLHSSSQLWIKSYHYFCSTRMTLAVNNLGRLICH